MFLQYELLQAPLPPKLLSKTGNLLTWAVCDGAAKQSLEATLRRSGHLLISKARECSVPWLKRIRGVRLVLHCTFVDTNRFSTDSLVRNELANASLLHCYRGCQLVSKLYTVNRTSYIMYNVMFLHVYSFNQIEKATFVVDFSTVFKSFIDAINHDGASEWTLGCDKSIQLRL
jgi:hypothetical protein